MGGEVKKKLPVRRNLVRSCVREAADDRPKCGLKLG